MSMNVKVEDNLPRTESVPVSEITKVIEPVKCETVKELSAAKQADLISSVLMPFLPKLVKDRQPHSAFHLAKLRPCPSTETMSDVLEVHTDIDPSSQKLEMRYTTSMYGKSVPVNSITSDLIRKVYEHLVAYIGKTNIPLYNPITGTGFWKRLVIRINYSGQVLVIVEYYKKHLTRSDLSGAINSALKLNVMTLAMKGCKVTSFIVKAYDSTECLVKCLYGPNALVEQIDHFKINVCDRPYTLVNQYAVLELSRSISDVAQINDSFTVLQIGVGYDAVTLYLSKLCKQFHMICNEITIGNHTASNAQLNKIDNFTFHSNGMPKIEVHEILQDVLSELTEEKNICVLLYEFPEGPDDGIQEMLKVKNVKKILFMTEVDIETQIKKLVSFCHGDQCPFIITKAIPVDISPKAENAKMIYLLERESLVSNLIEDNKELSVEKVTSLLKDRKGFSFENVTKFLSKEGGLSFHDKKPSNNSSCVPEENINSFSQSIYGQEKSVADNISRTPVKRVEAKQTIVKPRQFDSQFIPVEASSSNAAKVQDVSNLDISQPFKWDKDVLFELKSEEDYYPEEGNVPNQKQKGNKKWDKKKKKKRFGPNFVHDDWFIDMGVEDHFRMEIVRTIHECPLETNADYENQLRLKQMYAMAQAKLLTDVLQPAFPDIVKHRSRDLLFYMENMRAPFFVRSDSREFHAVVGIDPNTGAPSMTFEYYSPYKPIFMRPFNSALIESTYKHLMNVISRSELKLFNPLSKKGFWKRITMKVNNVGEIFIVIDAYAKGLAIAEVLSVKAMEELDSYFKTEARGFPIGNILLKLKQFSVPLMTRMMFMWKPFRKDVINDFTVTLCEDIRLWVHHPPGLAVLSDTISELGQLDKSSTLVQIGLHNGITIMSLAKVCKQVVLLYEDKCSVGHQFMSNAAENNINNISLHSSGLKQEYVRNLLTKSSLNTERNICLLVHDFTVTHECYRLRNAMLQTASNVRKVIFVSERRSPPELRGVFWLCKENNSIRNGAQKAFVITKAVAVDLSPYEDNAKLLYLLERAEDLQGQIETHKGYEDIKVQKFQEIEKIENYRVRFDQDKIDKEINTRISKVSTLCEFQKPVAMSYCRSEHSTGETYQKTISNYARNDNVEEELRNKRVDQNAPVLNITNSTFQEISQQPQHNFDRNRFVYVRKEDPGSLSAVAVQNSVETQEANKGGNEMYLPQSYAGNPIMTGIRDDSCEKTYEVKRREIFKNVTSISDTLKAALPLTSSHSNCGLVFHLNDLRPCPMIRTLCGKLQACSGIDQNSGRIDMVFQERSLTDQSADMYSHAIKYLYDKILIFMKTSPYDIYDSERKKGFWQSVCITVNDLGEAMLVVKGHVCEFIPGIEEKMAECSARLKSYFLEDAARKLLASLIFRICYLKVTKVKVLIGEEYLNYNIGPIKIQVFENSVLFSNPYGLDLLGNTLVEVAGLNPSNKVLQLGSEFDLLSVKLSKQCQKIFVLDQDKKTGHRLLTNMGKNNLSNLRFFAEDGTNKLLYVLENEIQTSDNICVVVFWNLHGITGDTLEALMKNVTVKKIVLVAEQLDSTDMEILISLCKEAYYCADPFIIKEVVPVEICPYSTCVKMVYLLIRKSDSTSHTIPAISCPDRRVTDVNYSGENRDAFKGSFLDEISAAMRYTETSTNQFRGEAHFETSGQAHFETSGEIQRNAFIVSDRDKHDIIQEHYRPVSYESSSQPKKFMYPSIHQDGLRDTGPASMKRMHELDKYDESERHFKSQKYDDTSTSSQSMSLSYNKNYRDNSDLLAYESEVMVNKGPESSRSPSDHMSRRNDPLIYHYDDSFSSTRHDNFSDSRHDSFPGNKHDNFSDSRCGLFPGNKYDSFSDSRHDSFPGNKHDNFSDSRRYSFSSTRHDKFSDSRHDSFPGNEHDSFSDSRRDSFSSTRHDNFSGSRHDSFPGNKHDNFSDSRHDSFPGNKHDNFSDSRHDSFPGTKHDNFSDSRHDSFPGNKHDNFSDRRHDSFPGNKHDNFSDSRRDSFPGTKHDNFSDSRHDSFPDNKHYNFSDSKHDSFPGTRRDNFSDSRYDVSFMGYRESQSVQNINDTHFRGESLQRSYNAPEKRDLASYTSRSHLISDTLTRANVEVLQHGCYNSDTSSSRGVYGNEGQFREEPRLSERDNRLPESGRTEFGRPQQYDRWEYDVHTRRNVR